MVGDIVRDIPKLGFGLMRLPRIDQKIDDEQVRRMVDLFLASGFTYFDTAYGYEDSEDAIGAALVKRHPRESYQLATKLPAWRASTQREAEEMFWTSLKRTGAEYFDFYLLHNIGAHRTRFFEEFDIWNFLEKRKQEGLIRHLGFSLHDKATLLDEVLTAHPDVDFVQLQINYADWESPLIESRTCYEVARSHGKPIVIMEPVKGGNLMTLPSKAIEAFAAVDPDASLASWAIRFAASLEGVVTVLSGMSNIQQMEDNISFMRNLKPLSPREMDAIAIARAEIDKVPSVPCTSCGYCLPACPQEVAIPGIFEALNLRLIFQSGGGAGFTYKWNTEAHGLQPASACIECGSCEEVCTQHIAIIDELKRAQAEFEA